MIILPETITTGFVPGMPAAELWDRVDALPGSLSAPLAEAAKRLGLYVVFGTYERGEERGEDADRGDRADQARVHAPQGEEEDPAREAPPQRPPRGEPLQHHVLGRRRLRRRLGRRGDLVSAGLGHRARI